MSGDAIDVAIRFGGQESLGDPLDSKVCSFFSFLLGFFVRFEVVPPSASLLEFSEENVFQAVRLL